MKNISSAILLFAIITGVILLGGCGADGSDSKEASPYTELNILENVSTEVYDGTINPSGLMLSMDNLSDETFVYGEWYVLEQKINGKWYYLDPIIDEEDLTWTSWGKKLSAHGGFAKMSYDWDSIYGNLKPGEYRIIVELGSESNSTDKDYFISTEFAIGE
jgi:hypothetical protein